VSWRENATCRPIIFRAPSFAWHMLCACQTTDPTPAGISLKTQELYVIVFCSRYIDLLWNFASLYNWCMKVPPCTVPEKRESMPQSALSTPARCPACPPPRRRCCIYARGHEVRRRPLRSCCSSVARSRSCSSCDGGIYMDGSWWRTTPSRTAR
jgi:hypothetical protein